VQFLWRLLHVVSSKEESGGKFEKPCERFEALKDLGRSSSESRELNPSQCSLYIRVLTAFAILPFHCYDVFLR
jgi:hypothetical protein